MRLMVDVVGDGGEEAWPPEIGVLLAGVEVAGGGGGRLGAGLSWRKEEERKMKRREGEEKEKEKKRKEKRGVMMEGWV